MAFCCIVANAGVKKFFLFLFLLNYMCLHVYILLMLSMLVSIISFKKFDGDNVAHGVNARKVECDTSANALKC